MKQIKKLSLTNVIQKLTRNEMRYVMAGSRNGGYSTYSECHIACISVPYHVDCNYVIGLGGSGWYCVTSGSW